MSNALVVTIVLMGCARIAIDLSPFLAARQVSQLIGFPAAHDSPTARLMARLFGVRDIGLGVLAFYAVLHPATAGFVLIFNACMDAGDLFSAGLPLARREGIDRGAARSGAMALTGGVMWIVVWLAL